MVYDYTSEGIISPDSRDILDQLLSKRYFAVVQKVIVVNAEVNAEVSLQHLPNVSNGGI